MSGEPNKCIVSDIHKLRSKIDKAIDKLQGPEDRYIDSLDGGPYVLEESPTGEELVRLRSANTDLQDVLKAVETVKGPLSDKLAVRVETVMNYASGELDECAPPAPRRFV